jgi:2-polyprenyl-6-methoxyphenol hydroxylase-like FAD-dependent oxidoreductase
MSAKPEDDAPVLIVGGSLVGLSTAVFLASHGVIPLVVERHASTAIHPRAALVNQRTIEIYRGVGLEREILEASELEFEQNGAIVSVETLAGRELEYYFRHINDGVEGLSPSPRVFITQIGLEPILRRRAEELHARLAYSTEVVSLERDGNGVRAVLRARQDGAERTVHAQYAVAADGSKSSVRDRLGIGLSGRTSFSNSITIYFRADILPLIGDRNLSVIYVFGPGLQGFFRFSKAGDAGFLVVNKALNAAGELTSDLWDDTSNERCAELVREALGAPELDLEIENVQRWNSTADWAERFADGPIFLAGDAAHNMPPTGGFGGNVGVQDGHNLAWKLALVLSGKAGPELLATYDTERRPVGEFSVEQAYTRYVLRLAPELGTDDLQPIVPEYFVELGYRYHSQAIVPEADDDGGVYENPHEPSARPGTRAPHVVVARKGDAVSTLDLIDRNFVLLAGVDGEAWCGAARDAAARLDVDLAVYRLGAGGDLGDPDGRFSEIYATGAEGAVLVRPDGFIAWRARSASAEPERTLFEVLGKVLSR